MLEPKLLKINSFFKLPTIFFVTFGLVFFVFASLEPSRLTAATAADTVQVTLTVDAGISITSPSDEVMAPNISTSANDSVGDIAWTVTTNNQAGYQLAVKASQDPALQDSGTSESFADYTTAVAETPEVWSVSSAYEFGYSAFGADVQAEHKGTQSACEASGALGSTDMKWRDFKITDEVIATTGSETSTSGTLSTLCLAAEQDTIFAPSGTYTGNVTATATTL